jgi:hypothetical protein
MVYFFPGIVFWLGLGLIFYSDAWIIDLGKSLNQHNEFLKEYTIIISGSFIVTSYLSGHFIQTIDVWLQKISKNDLNNENSTNKFLQRFYDLTRDYRIGKVIIRNKIEPGKFWLTFCEMTEEKAAKANYFYDISNLSRGITCAFGLLSFILIIHLPSSNEIVIQLYILSIFIIMIITFVYRVSFFNIQFINFVANFMKNRTKYKLRTN